MNQYLTVMKRSFDFSGRSSRQEYRVFYLVFLIIAVLAVGLDALLSTGFAADVPDPETGGTRSVPTGAGYLSSAVSLIHLIPYLSVSVCRLHDTGRRALIWFVLLPVLLLIGIVVAALPSGGANIALMAIFLACFACAIAVFVFLVLPSEQGPNCVGQGDADTQRA